ncbi:MAG: hypothetical protein HQ538_06770 [Parcubacteria group bacterium]|nr:hypothetical protein [Parcubacteria group bacterium]
MKKIIFSLVSFISALALTFASSPIAPVQAQSDTAHRLAGRIVLQVEENGEAWYVNPVDYRRYSLGRPRDAWNIMRALGLGVTDANLAKVPINGTEWTINQDMIKYVDGRILIQVELNGEAWYVSPVNLQRYYMGRPADAFQLMRNLGLGITNSDLEQIEVGVADVPDDSSDSDSDSDSSDDSSDSDDDSSDDSDSGDDSSSDNIATDLIQPSDLVYKGAFRLPAGADGDDGPRGWSWGGTAATYYPSGDPSGASDGYTGSLYGTGHDVYKNISEINIPSPVISSSKNLSDLNRAQMLQEFRDIIITGETELPRVGLAYLGKQGSQSSGKLYFGWGEHFQEENDNTHGWMDVNLSSPQRKGDWRIDSKSAYSTSDYIFNIPSNWAASNTPGKLLATGRYRDGGWSGQGPSLYAYGPWNDGNPPSAGTELSATTLLEYDTSIERDALTDSSARTMDDYHHPDEWSGAAWLTKNNKAAVIFAGTKGVGDYWYGDSNGACTTCEGERGWWSTTFEGRIIFYDPSDLAAVAAGTMESHEPQPYAYLNIDQYLYHINSNQQWYHLGAIAFDRSNGILYVFEFLGDSDTERPLVHVFKVN